MMGLVGKEDSKGLPKNNIAKYLLYKPPYIAAWRLKSSIYGG